MRIRKEEGKGHVLGIPAAGGCLQETGPGAALQSSGTLREIGGPRRPALLLRGLGGKGGGPSLGQVSEVHAL